MTHFHIDRIPKAYLLLFLFLTACLFYGNSLSNGYNLDDELVTQSHPLTSQGLKAIPKIFSSPFYQDAAGTSFEYRPVLLTSFAIEHQLFGESPTISHGVNILLYGVTALLVFWLLSALVAPTNKLLPFLASLIFIIHPVHTEAVNNIKSRDELLALGFSLLAGLLFLKRTADFKKAIIFSIGGSVVFALAIFSKLSALPFAWLIPISLVLFRKVTVIHLLGVSTILTSISFALFTQLSIKPPALFYVGSMLLPLALYVVVNIEKIRKGIKSKWGQKYMISDYKFTPARSGLILSALFFLGVTGVYQSSMTLVASLVSIGFLFFIEKEKGRLLPNILLALFGLVSAMLFRLNFIHVLCFLPLVLHVLSEDWKAKRFSLWILSVLFFISLSNDILNEEGWSLVNIIAFVLLYLISYKNTNKVKYATVAVMVIFSAIIFKQQRDGLIMFWISAAAYLLFEINKKKDTGFRIALAGVLMASVFSIISSQNFTGNFNGFYPPQEITAQPPAAGQRVLDFSENPIMYEPSAEKRIATSVRVAGEYLRLLLFPHPLRFYYGYNTVPLVGFKNGGFLLSILVFLFLGFIAIYFIRREPLITFSSVLLSLGVFQFSNLLVPVAGVMGERLIYTASLGYAIMVAILFLKIYSYGRENKINYWSVAFCIALILTVAVSLIYTFHRNQKWEAPIILYSHDIQYLSHSAKAHNILANESYKQALLPENVNEKTKLLNQAVNHFKKCIAIYPDFPFAWLDLGNAYLTLGDPTAALEAFVLSTKVDSHHGESYFKTAGLYESTGDFFKAEEYYRLAIEKDPGIKAAYFNLSALYFSQQLYDKGFNVCDEALKIWPGEYGLLLNKGNAMASLGEYDEAVEYLEKALLQQPGNADVIYKIIYLCDLMGDIKKAETYRKMLQ